MASMLDFLPRKIQRMDGRTFDAPQRTPLINQGGTPPGIQRVAPRELRKVLANVGAPIPTFRDVDRFADLVVLPFTVLVVGVPGAVNLITSNTRKRIVTIFRNSSASAGVLFVGYGIAADINTATLSLAAGEQAIFDAVIPQNDVWVSTDVAPTSGVMSYALSQVP